LELLDTKQETRDTTTFSFRAPRPIYYKAGQYGTFSISKVRNEQEKENENKSEENDTTWTRAWTISSAPRADPFGEYEFTITVKHKQNGKVTSMMHNKETLQLIRFRLLAVEGRFIVPQSTAVASSTIVLAVAGSGVTPAMAMLRFLSTNRDVVPYHVVLFYSAKTLDDVIILNELVTSGWA
jgi:ferredoxin-NADP reductase